MRRGAAVAALALLAGCAHGPETDQPPPDYVGALELRSVGPVRPGPGELRGHPVLATFFATYCFPCLGQLPLYGEFAREYAGQGLKVVAVGRDLEGEKMLRPFADDSGYPFAVLVADEALRKGETPFGSVSVLPSTVILAKDGTVVAAWAGLAQADDIRKALEKALKE